MKVTIIGSGNVATVMGKELKESGHKVLQVYNHRLQHAQTLAAALEAEATDRLSLITPSADLYLIAVTDDAVAEVAARLSVPGKTVVHTAGSISKNILENTGGKYGVAWPMKMVRKNMAHLAPVTMVVDGDSPETVAELSAFASLFTNDVIVAGDEKRAKLHMLASFTLNFTNHLFHLAADYCEKEQIDFSLFYPLIEASVQRLRHGHPKDLQAGPASRGDSKTIAKHLKLLEMHPQAAGIYRAMTESILSISGNNNP
ncbi:DUF2520 domain-containing protein [Sediminibacterium roseum]|uniref:DUF2520 domain-containing protein n=2 Tax=Sediminibacterium roseum TaxID=1978412 RepID=A0ABW9ZVL7_9BACT|nr:DUF2520 domain-containing protein [Sediminibacterium roseum]